MCLRAYTDSEGQDEPVHQYSLIRAYFFAIRYPLTNQVHFTTYKGVLKLLGE